MFIRPSSYAGMLATTIIDERGRFLGDALPNGCFAVQVPAGEHLFISWAENTAAVRATLAPGKTYFVEVSPRVGLMSARVQLFAQTPRNKNWLEVPRWLAECQRTQPDEQAGQAYLASRGQDVQERVQRGPHAMTEYSAEELAERTILPEDGLDAAALTAMLGGAASPPPAVTPSPPAPAPMASLPSAPPAAAVSVAPVTPSILTGCTSDGDCRHGRRCTGGACRTAVRCTKDVECPASELCNQGTCAAGVKR